MKVKVGDKIYDGAKEPVMVILTDEDKENISNMKTESYKYVVAPDNIPNKDLLEWMEEDKATKFNHLLNKRYEI